MADPEEVVGRLVEVIRTLRPATIVTFDPAGIYGHPDHVAISATATEAYRRAAGEPGGPTTLYHQALSRGDLAGWAAMDAQMAALRGEEGLPSRRSPPPTTCSSGSDSKSWPAPTRTSRPRSMSARSSIASWPAFACHASQIREDWSAAPREMLEAWLGREAFIRVYPPPLPDEQETALRGVV